MPSPPPPPLLPSAYFPLRNCSATFFRHLAKTGGSTVQAVLRRNEQIGNGFYYAAHGTWVEIRPKEWRALFDEIVDDPDAFIARHPRLLVSLHKQTASQFPPLSVRYHPPQRRDPRFHIWEDVASHCC